jgi:hypothetical protein
MASGSPENGEVHDSLEEESGTWTDNASSLQVTLVNNLPPSQNPFNPLDVNFTGQVTPLDVLLVVNAVNSAGPGHVLSGLPFQADGGLATLVDSDGDGALSANDVLRVINHLNNTAAPPADPGEGESPTTTRASSEPPPLPASQRRPAVGARGPRGEPPLPASQRVWLGDVGSMHVPSLPDSLANVAWRPNGSSEDDSNKLVGTATRLADPFPFPNDAAAELIDPGCLVPHTDPVDAAFAGR